MWGNIWEALRALITFDDRLARVEKKNEKFDQKHEDVSIKLVAFAVELERIAERDQWREKQYQHALELERAKLALEHEKLANEQVKLENERLRLELERERRQLPPVTVNLTDDHSPS